MTPADLKAARRVILRLSVAGFGNWVGGASPRTVRRWEAGSLPVPDEVAAKVRGELDRRTRQARARIARGL